MPGVATPNLTIKYPETATGYKATPTTEPRDTYLVHQTRITNTKSSIKKGMGESTSAIVAVASTPFPPLNP